MIGNVIRNQVNNSFNYLNGYIENIFYKDTEKYGEETYEPYYTVEDRLNFYEGKV